MIVKYQCVNSLKVSALYLGLRFKKIFDFLELIFIAYTAGGYY
jgi:hypothetical protein